jgi:hypothetical protein
VRSLVPAGAVATTHRGTRPGTPYFADAPAVLVAALTDLDVGESPSHDAHALAAVLSAARPRDALTLWHLLARTAGEDRGRVHDALAFLVPPPPGVTREGILRGDPAMQDAWWGELGLGSAEFWRQWTVASPR